MVTHSPRPTIMDRLQKRLESRRNGEQGLALLDVLLGMAIFGLIVIITISSISKIRERAFETGTNSDARSIGTEIEAEFTTAQSYPADAAAVTALATLTKGNTVAWYGKGVDPTGSSAFQFCVEHASDGTEDAWAAYDSSLGGVVASGRGEGCPTQPAIGTEPTP